MNAALQHLLLVVFGCRAPEAPVFDEPPSLLPLPECPEGRELFRADTVHRLDLALAPEAWQGLVEEARNTPEYDGPPMTWRTATLSWNGTPLAAPVQVRPKGHFSRITAVGEAFPLKLDFDELDAGQELDGLRKLNLHPMGEELSVLRERLSYGALREAGLPTARTALVELSVNGTALGTYNAVEHLRGDFVRCHFPEPYGDLYKPEEAVGSLAFLGDQIEDYPVANHKWPDETDHQAFLRLVATLDEGELLDIDEVLDVDRTLAYLAESALGRQLTGREILYEGALLRREAGLQHVRVEPYCWEDRCRIALGLETGSIVYAGGSRISGSRPWKDSCWLDLESHSDSWPRS